MDFGVMQTNKVLRGTAREQLHGVWKKMALTFFAAFLMGTPLYILAAWKQIDEDNGIVTIAYTVVYAGYLVVSGPFALGFTGYFLKRIRSRPIAFKSIFDGFARFKSSFLLMLLISVFTILWTLLLIVPGIIKGLGYSMAFYIMYDNPDMKPREALRQSAMMMKGHKRQFFLLGLSFIGWFLLGILTLGVGYFWLYPYMYLSVANFYENLKVSAAQTPVRSEVE